MYNKYIDFLGVSSLKDDVKTFIVKSTMIYYVIDFLIMLSSTFLILYALKSITIYELGMIISVQVAIQIFLDYPTAILSDIIGHKSLLMFSLILYAIGFVLLAISENTFFILLIAFIFISLGGVQETGAFESWFDTNYRLKTINEDPERKIYALLKTRFGAIAKLVTALSFLIGGYMVYYFRLPIVWILQAVFLFGSCIYLMFTLRETNRIHLIQEKITVSYYNKKLKEGLKYAFSNKTLRYMIIGTAIFSACVSIWSNYMLFPLFQDYGKTEDRIGIMRSSIWFLESISLFMISRIAKRIGNVKKPILLLIAIQSPVMFGGVYLTLKFHPEQAIFDLFPFIFLILSFSLVTIPLLFFNTLSAKIYLDVIPDESRTGVYSLLPTFFAIILLLFQPFGAYLVQTHGFLPVLLLLLVIGLIASSIIAYGVIIYNPEDINQDLDVFLPFLQSRNVLVKELTALVPMNSPKRVKSILRNIRKELLLIALDDDKITDQEQELVISIMHDMKGYAETLDKILEDGIVTDDERDLLEMARDKLWLNSEKLVVKDDIVTPKEKKLLLLLAEFLSNTAVE